MITEAAIPAGWKQAKLGDIGDAIIGLTYSPKDVVKMGGTLVLRSSNIKGNKVDYNDQVRVNIEIPQNKLTRKGDILICARNGSKKLIGKNVCIDEKSSNNAFGAFMSVYRTNNPLYIFWFFQSNSYKKQISRDLGPTINQVTTGNLCSFKVLLPPLPEQEKIVEVLEAWDNYLEKLTRSIKLKKKVKVGLMEKLLTGKVFLNADSMQNKKTRYFRTPKHWQIVSIGEVANEVTKKNTSNINLPVLSCTKHAGLVDSLKFFKKQIFSKKLNTYKIVDMGQFAYATNHIEEGSIGLQNLYDSGLVSPMYTVFKTDKQKILNGYLFPLLKTVLFRHIFKAKTSSSVNRRGSLRWKSFSKIEIPLPPMEDQEKIANILTTADRDLEAMEKKKTLVEQQKKFLLNNLITGRIRLPEFAEASKH